MAEGLDYVAVWNAAFLLSDDLNEAMTAFAEKTEAGFQRTVEQECVSASRREV